MEKLQDQMGKLQDQMGELQDQMGKSASAKKHMNSNHDILKQHPALKMDFVKRFRAQEKTWLPTLKKLTSDTYIDKSKYPTMSGCKQSMHGIVGKDIDGIEDPLLMVRCDKKARPGYSNMSAHEYHDTPKALRQKVKLLAKLIKAAENAVIYSGAGISTASGIADYATKAGDRSISKGGKKKKGYKLPTFSHRALTKMFFKGMFKRWIQQNHDGLPQKAGMPQEHMNEIHGAWYDPSNPVVPMTGTLRDDLYADLETWEDKADLSIAIGTSLSGMAADSIVQVPASNFQHAGVGLGSVIIGIQRTKEDESSSLRIFALIDEVFVLLCHELNMLPVPLSSKPTGRHFSKDIEPEEHVYCVPYDKYGNLSSTGETSFLDLRAEVSKNIPKQNVKLNMGPGKGFRGKLNGISPQGHYLIRLPHQREGSKKHGIGQRTYKLGSWWIEALVNGRVPKMPIINVRQYSPTK